MRPILVQPRFAPSPLALAATLTMALAFSHAPLAHAQKSSAPATGAAIPIAINIPAQPLGQALNELARQANLQMTFPAASVAGKQAPPVAGKLTVSQALERMLEGSGLSASSDGASIVVRPASPPANSESTLPTVSVTAGAMRERATGPVSGYVARRSATGAKTDTPIIETPQSISVVTAERMEALGATTVKDVLAYTPGIDVAPYGTDSRYDWISIRGFDAYSPGFYQDGLQLRNNSGWAIWQTENYGLERIEVMRGPTSVLYGQNSPGGMVNVVTKRPTKDAINEIQLQVGDHSRKQLAVDHSGSLDADGKALYRVVGLVRNAELPVGQMPDDRVYLAPSLTLMPSADTTLTLQSQWLKSRAGIYVRTLPEKGSLVPTPAGTRLPANVYTGEPDYDHLNQDQWSLGYMLEHRADSTWTFRQNARYAELKTDYGQVLTTGFVTVNSDTTDPANYRSLGRGVNGSQEKARSLAIDNQAQATFSLGEFKHTVLVGLDHQRSHFDQRTNYTGTVAPIDLYAPTYGQSVTAGPTDVSTQTDLIQTGLYLQDQLRYGNWVTTLAGRHDQATVDGHDRLLDAHTHQTDGKATGRAGVVYLHPSGWAPYASYATSFSPVTVIDPDSGKPFAPETGRQVEAGVRYQPSNYKGTYSAAIFDLRRQNYINYDPLTSIPKQTGEIQVRGLELEAALTPIHNINLTAAYAFTPKADVTQSADPSAIGKQASAVPRHRLSLWGDHRFASGVKVGLGVRHVGSTKGLNESAAAPVPAYTLLDGMLGYDFDHWVLALHVQNLTDKDNITNCGFGNCYHGTPRRASLTATYRW